MTRGFDARRWRANVLALAKAKGMKIGDLERAAGVSLGYLSRFVGADKDSLPNIKAVESLANVLGVTLDDICYLDFTGISVTEQYVLDFLGKLRQVTMSDELTWTCDKEVHVLMAFDDCMPDRPVYPFVSAVTAENVTTGETYPTGEYVCSTMTDGRFGEPIVNGDFFHADFRGKATIYISDVRFEADGKGVHEHEVFIRDAKAKGAGLDGLASTKVSGALLSDAVRLLHQEVVASMGRVHLPNRVRLIIDDLMDDSNKSQKIVAKLGDDINF